MSETVFFREVVASAIGGGWGSDQSIGDDTKVAVIRGTDFESVAVGDTANVPIRYEKISKLASRTLAAGDLLLEISDGSSAKGQPTGRSLLVRSQWLESLGIPVIPASFCRLIRIDRSRVLPKYAYYALQDMHRSGRAFEYENRSTGISNFQFQHFLDAERLYLPTLEDQEKIAHALGTLDDKIALNRRLSETLEAIAQVLFQSWFVDFDPVRAKASGEAPDAICQRLGLIPELLALFPDRLVESELGEIPEGWDARPLDQIANYLNGLALQKFPPTSDDEWLPVIKIAQLKSGSVVGADRASHELKPEYIVGDGDVLFSWSGSLEVDLWCNGRGALNQHLFKVTSDQYPKWFYFLWTKHHLENFRAIAAGKAVTMGHIQRKHLTEALCAAPPTALIEAASELFAPMLLDQIESRKQSRKLNSIRDALLPKLLSGEIQLPAGELP